MLRFALQAAALIAASALAVSAQSQNLTMQVAGVSRHYILYAPQGLPANPPLVYVIHGFNMTAQQMVGITKMNALADTAKFLVAYPDALPDKNNQPSWDMSGANDFNFILAIIDSADAKYHINRSRVYASGFSQGGFMSFQLGCRYADKFAAIAPVSGLLTGSCNASRPVPMFLTFGTADVATPANFMQSVSAWTKMLECPATPVVTSPYPSANASSVVTRIAYAPCKNGTEVIADSVKGGPHEWPMDTRTKVNNSVEVWNFVKKYSISAGTGMGRKTNPGAPGLAFAYSGGMIRLPGNAGSARVRVLDNQGRLVASAPAGGGRIEFKDKPAGVYRILVEDKGMTTALKLVIP